MNQVVRVQESTYSGIDKQGHEGNKDSGVPTSAEIRENTRCFISETLAESLIKIHKRYGKPQSIDRLREQILAHTFH